MIKFHPKSTEIMESAVTLILVFRQIFPEVSRWQESGPKVTTASLPSPCRLLQTLLAHRDRPLPQYRPRALSVLSSPQAAARLTSVQQPSGCPRWAAALGGRDQGHTLSLSFFPCTSGMPSRGWWKGRRCLSRHRGCSGSRVPEGRQPLGPGTSPRTPHTCCWASAATGLAGAVAQRSYECPRSSSHPHHCCLGDGPL